MLICAAAAIALLASDLPARIWRDPGPVETVDFSAAAGGVTLAPRAPFRFLGEPAGGTSSKIQVADAEGLEWRVKGGPEARADSFATRLVAALGYFAEVTWFVAEGRAVQLPAVRPYPRLLDLSGRFTWVSFELREPATRFLPESWTWGNSPFRGSHEFQGLKLLILLLSNWDNKDARDERRGSNVGVWERDDRGQRVRAHFVNDWGQSMGGWKSRFGNGTCWDCASFSAQTRRFVTGVEGDLVRFGYRGQHTSDFSNDISREDVAWLLKYLGRITDAQVRTGLLVSGATRQEEDCFARSLRMRIEQLRALTEGR